MLKTTKINTILKNDFFEVQNNDVINENTGKALQHLKIIEKGTRCAGAVAICQLGDRLLLINNYRYGIGKMSLEFSRGYVEKDENPEECAIRELFEETGIVFNHQLDTIERLGEMAVNSSFLATIVPFYLIKINQPFKELNMKLQKEENIKEFQWLLINEIDNMIKEGKIIDSFTIAGMNFLKI